MARQLRTDSVPVSLIVVGGTREPWLPVLEKAGWQCKNCSDLRKADDLLRQSGPSIGIIDLSRDEFSLHGLANLVSQHKHIRWIAFIRESQLKSDATCQFIVNFCIDFFTSPIPDAQLHNTIGHQLGMLKLEKKVWPELNLANDFGIVGESIQMKRLRDQVKRVGATDVCTLVLGESGTGREVIAKAVHYSSARSKSPFISINCAAASELRMDKELFNSEESYISTLEQADGGTILLTNITALSLSQQEKLLRFIQEGSIETDEGIKEIDARVIATCGSEVEKSLSNGEFDEELYHHLNVLRIQVPNLRDRNGDVTVLAKYYLERYARELNSQVRAFSDKAMEALNQYHWPGNIRELDNHIKRLVLMTDKAILEAEDLDLPKRTDGKMSLKTIRERSEKDALQMVLDLHSGHVSPAAKELGVSRATMYRLLNKHSLISESRVAHG